MSEFFALLIAAFMSLGAIAVLLLMLHLLTGLFGRRLPTEGARQSYKAPLEFEGKEFPEPACFLVGHIENDLVKVSEFAPTVANYTQKPAVGEAVQTVYAFSF